MSWQLWVRSAETILESARMLPSEEIISLIKRVNPTRLQLSESEREHGYQIKNRLQNLLLENYGEAFYLAPHPYSSDIILIKHNALPSIDACHADLKALSARALDTVGAPAPSPAELPPRSKAKAKARKPVQDCSPKATLMDAELLLEQYEYPQAEEILAALRLTDARDLPLLVKAARLLVEEIGVYQRAIDLLLAQPKQLLKDKAVREILAQSYYGNGMIPEARALFDAIHPADLGKSALYAYADISFKDGNLSKAFHLLKLSEGTEGFVTAHASLRQVIEAAMLEEALPYMQQAEAAFALGDLARAGDLLQHALSLYPNFQQASQLAGEIEARKAGAESGRLWERFECSKTPQDRLDLLEQLLERDKGNAEKIKALVAQERYRRLQETVEDRLQKLRELAEQQSWEPCFDIVLWLSRQADEDGYRRGCSISPFFSLLYRNKKLQRLPDEEAKGLWLRFVRLAWTMQQGEAESCWNILQETKPYFRSYPLFKEEYDRVAEQEREKAQDEVQQLLDRLDELEDPEGNGYAFGEAKRLVAQLRKRSALLPADEASKYKESAERILYCLDPRRRDEENALDYREYLLLGNTVKAAKFKESHNQPWMQGLLKYADDEIAEKFAISAEPIALTVSPDLVVDLTTEAAPSGLEFLCSSHRHLLFKESDESMVVINVGNMTATRFGSPRFADLAILDMLPDRDVFLFVDRTKNTVWRATLSHTQSSFTATFEMNDHFSAPAGSTMSSFYMSSTKDNVYYAFIRNGDWLQVVKQSIDQISTVERTFEVNGKLEGEFRLSYQPDRFVIRTADSTTVLESNLTQIKGSSKVGTSQMLDCLAINVSRGQIYALGDGMINVLNPKLWAVKQYLNAESSAYLAFTIMATVCVEKSTAFFNINGRCLFYNMETNKFSQKFAVGRVLHTETPSRWYYVEPDLANSAIRIKDLTEEVDSLLEWRVLLAANAGEDAAMRFAEQLEDPDFFSIVKPG